MRSGMVAVVGRPNVGKSTLINALVGAKVSIVTAKPQTTRHRILAVRSDSDCQIVFIDTPGIHRNAHRAMNRIMNRTASNALVDADLVLFIVDANQWLDEDRDVLERLNAVSAPVFAVLNKIDRVSPRERLLEVIASTSQRGQFAEIIPVSARRGDNLDRLLELIPPHLPVSPPLFPDDMSTDRSEEFHIAEIIREKLTLALHQELPYGISVQVERLHREADRATIHAIVWVERDSQKGIVVGKSGKVLKKVGSEARVEIADRLGQRTHLELWVKVKSNWADNDTDLVALGYEIP